MKTIFTLIISMAASLFIWAGSTHIASPYLLCEGTDTITQTTTVLKPEQVTKLIHSSTEKCQKMETKNQKENTTTENNQSFAPNFLKLFFNFI